MVRVRLEVGKEVPNSYHLARYCFPGTVESVRDGGERKVVTSRAFEWRGNKAAPLSFSVMEKFEGENERDVIYEVCRHRGRLVVEEDGHYVKLGVGMIRRRRYDADRRVPRIIFCPGDNPAHVTLYPDGLMVSLELASLATERGKFFPVPIPIPEVVHSQSRCRCG